MYFAAQTLKPGYGVCITDPLIEQPLNQLQSQINKEAEA